MWKDVRHRIIDGLVALRLELLVRRQVLVKVHERIFGEVISAHGLVDHVTHFIHFELPGEQHLHHAGLDRL